jgi:hypothetical protein
MIFGQCQADPLIKSTVFGTHVRNIHGTSYLMILFNRQIKLLSNYPIFDF